jgi:hypothetical protein
LDIGKLRKEAKKEDKEKTSLKEKGKLLSLKTLGAVISSKKSLEIASKFEDMDNSSISSFSKKLYNCGNFYNTVSIDLHKDYLQREDWIYLILFMAFVVILMINLLWTIMWMRNKVLENYTKTLVKQIILDRDKEIQLWSKGELEKLKNPESVRIEKEIEEENDLILVYQEKKGECDVSLLGGVAIILLVLMPQIF